MFQKILASIVVPTGGYSLSFDKIFHDDQKNELIVFVNVTPPPSEVLTTQAVRQLRQHALLISLDEKSVKLYCLGDNNFTTYL